MKGWIISWFVSYINYAFTPIIIRPKSPGDLITITLHSDIQTWSCLYVGVLQSVEHTYCALCLHCPSVQSKSHLTLYNHDLPSARKLVLLPAYNTHSITQGLVYPLTAYCDWVGYCWCWVPLIIIWYSRLLLFWHPLIQIPWFLNSFLWNSFLFPIILLLLFLRYCARLNAELYSQESLGGGGGGGSWTLLKHCWIARKMARYPEQCSRTLLKVNCWLLLEILLDLSQFDVDRVFFFLLGTGARGYWNWDKCSWNFVETMLDLADNNNSVLAVKVEGQLATTV